MFQCLHKKLQAFMNDSNLICKIKLHAILHSKLKSIFNLILNYFIFHPQKIIIILHHLIIYFFFQNLYYLYFYLDLIIIESEAIFSFEDCPLRKFDFYFHFLIFLIILSFSFSITFLKFFLKGINSVCLILIY